MMAANYYYYYYYLLQGTIKENILLAVDESSPAANDEAALHQSCKDAEIHDFIVSLPDGNYSSLLFSSPMATPPPPFFSLSLRTYPYTTPVCSIAPPTSC